MTNWNHKRSVKTPFTKHQQLPEVHRITHSLYATTQKITVNVTLRQSAWYSTFFTAHCWRPRRQWRSWNREKRRKTRRHWILLKVTHNVNVLPTFEANQIRKSLWSLPDPKNFTWARPSNNKTPKGNKVYSSLSSVQWFKRTPTVEVTGDFFGENAKLSNGNRSIRYLRMNRSVVFFAIGSSQSLEVSARGSWNGCKSYETYFQERLLSISGSQENVYGRSRKATSAETQISETILYIVKFKVCSLCMSRRYLF